MTTLVGLLQGCCQFVVEAYRLDRYDNALGLVLRREQVVVEAYRLDRYDNYIQPIFTLLQGGCRSLSFG